jgi:hypothetical protein
MTRKELIAYLNTDEGRQAYEDFAQAIKDHCEFLPKDISEFWDHETFGDFERLYERRQRPRV